MSRSVHSPSPILIVGGGPTGLTLAIELARRDVPFRLVDRRSGPSTTSRSFTLHARTLELFEQAGYAHRFVERGIPDSSMDIRFEGVDDVTQLDFTQLISGYAYFLVIEQNVTEAVLRNQLSAVVRERGGTGGQIEWNTRLGSLTEDSSGRMVASLVHIDDGDRVEAAHFDWVVGCDGLHSTVRTECGLTFDGDEYKGSMRMVDAPLEGFSLSGTSTHYLTGKDHMALIVKLPGGNYRVLLSNDDGIGSDRSNVPAAAIRRELQLAIDQHFHGNVRIGEPEWATRFPIWHRISSGFGARIGQGRAFVVGDAAHIHSPAGGQGMNACIQDAFNLGWKLALVAKGIAPESLLDTYEFERRPIAEQVIAGTDRLHQIILAHGEDIEGRRNKAHAPGFNLVAVQQISGVAYTYRDPAVAATGLAAGDRAPDVVLGHGLRLHELFRHSDYTLLILQRGARTEATAAIEAAAHRYAGALRTVVITQTPPREALNATVIAETNDVFDLYGIPDDDSLCLIRPDGYIRFRSGFGGAHMMFAVLSSVLRGLSRAVKPATLGARSKPATDRGPSATRAGISGE